MPDTVKFTSLVQDIFRNGLRDNVNKNIDIAGFVLGAIDNGFTVKLSGFMPEAKKGKVTIYLRWKRDSDELRIIMYKGEEKQLECSYEIHGFMWCNVEVVKGRFNIEINNQKQFICSLT